VNPVNSSLQPGFAYVGCFTSPGRKGHGKGINVFRTDPANGTLRHVQLLPEFVDPSFLVLDHSGKYLYSVSASEGKISAFSVDSRSGQLTWLNTRSSGGVNPVALCLDPSNRFLLTVNYSSGSVVVLPVAPDGSLEPQCDFIQLQGEPGPDKKEQDVSHPHHISFDNQGPYVFVPDKGYDKIFVFSFDARTGKLALNDTLSVEAAPGAGPRHIAFHPGGAYGYVINELDSTISTFSYAPDREVFEQIQVISALPAGFSGETTGAEIQVAPSGKFVYASNRGHDSIVVCAVDELTGYLNAVQWESTQGATPRYFTLDPSGNFLYALNQDSDSLVMFKVDQATGTLTPGDQTISIGSPVCMVFTR
jgi:6-phosphogluconolactonase